MRLALWMNLTVKYSEGIGWRGWKQIPCGDDRQKNNAKATATAFDAKFAKLAKFRKVRRAVFRKVRLAVVGLGCG